MTENKLTLSKKELKVVQIPLTFGNEEIVEIGWYAFCETKVEFAYISKNVRFLNWGAFEETPLKEIRFEKGSKLEKIYLCFMDSFSSKEIPNLELSLTLSSFILNIFIFVILS